MSALVNQTKLCGECGLLKSPEDFSPDKGSKDGRRGTCKKCHAKYRNSIPRTKPSKKAARKYRLRHNYGISEDEYAAALVNQNGRCAICKSAPIFDPLCVDHDHETGAVRGLLCRKCNKGLGFFCDDVTSLQEAILYLSK